MRTIHGEMAGAWLGGALCAIGEREDPTDEQLRLIQAMGRGYFGIDDALDLEPLVPAELAVRVTDPGSRYRLVQFLVVLEFARHPASEVLAESVERWAAALGVDEPMLRVARDAAEHSRELLIADWSRFQRTTPTEPRLADATEEQFGRQMARLAHSPSGSLGRAFLDFYERWVLTLPNGDDAHAVGLVSHDFAHVITGYQPNDAVDETALSALLVSSTNGEEHFSALVASMALYEVDLLSFPGIDGTKGVLGRPGAPETFAEAMRRGAACTHDVATFDHFSLLDWPLDEVREVVGIPPRQVWAVG